MAHYADLDENNIVTHVFVGRDENDGDTDWEKYYNATRTSYNTRGGIHYDPNTGMPSIDQSKAFRYNYAGQGMTFDPNFGPDGAFYFPQPYPSWTLNPNTAEWEPPIPMPETGGLYQWDEETVSWIEIAES